MFVTELKVYHVNILLLIRITTSSQTKCKLHLYEKISFSSLFLIPVVIKSSLGSVLEKWFLYKWINCITQSKIHFWVFPLETRDNKTVNKNDDKTKMFNTETENIDVAIINWGHVMEDSCHEKNITSIKKLVSNLYWYNYLSFHFYSIYFLLHK